MTTEPKFVPSNGATIKINEFETSIKLVDCVGYVIPEANGFVDEDGNPRMVKARGLKMLFLLWRQQK